MRFELETLLSRIEISVDRSVANDLIWLENTWAPERACRLAWVKDHTTALIKFEADYRSAPYLLNVGRFQLGSIVVDDSAPHRFPAGATIELMRSCADVLIEEVGAFTSPKPSSEVRRPADLVLGIRTVAALLQSCGPHPILNCVQSRPTPVGRGGYRASTDDQRGRYPDCKSMLASVGPNWISAGMFKMGDEPVPIQCLSLLKRSGHEVG